MMAPMAASLITLIASPLIKLVASSLINFNYEPRFNGGFSRDNLPRIKDGVYVKVYVINLDGKWGKGTLRVSLFIDRNKAV